MRLAKAQASLRIRAVSPAFFVRTHNEVDEGSDQKSGI